MADPAAGTDLHAASALPHPEGHLQVLAAPDVHGLIVGAGGPEILSPDAEQTARHHRRAVRPRTVLSHLDEDDKVEFSYCFAIFFNLLNLFISIFRSKIVHLAVK